MLHSSAKIGFQEIYYKPVDFKLPLAYSPRVHRVNNTMKRIFTLVAILLLSPIALTVANPKPAEWTPCGRILLQNHIAGSGD